jgi:hypothetical protein
MEGVDFKNWGTSSRAPAQHKALSSNSSTSKKKKIYQDKIRFSLIC